MSANLLETLRITLFGMLGIFAVIVVIYLAILLMNKVFSNPGAKKRNSSK